MSINAFVFHTLSNGRTLISNVNSTLPDSKTTRKGPKIDRKANHYQHRKRTMLRQESTLNLKSIHIGNIKLLIRFHVFGFSPKEARGAWEAILGPLKYKKVFPLFVASLEELFLQFSV